MPKETTGYCRKCGAELFSWHRHLLFCPACKETLGWSLKPIVTKAPKQPHVEISQTSIEIVSSPEIILQEKKSRKKAKLDRSNPNHPDHTRYFKNGKRRKHRLGKDMLNVDSRRKKRLAENGGTHTEEEWQEVKARFNNRCALCGKQGKLTRDHIIPVSKGGSDNIENIQPLCFECNGRKGTKTLDLRGKVLSDFSIS